MPRSFLANLNRRVEVKENDVIFSGHYVNFEEIKEGDVWMSNPHRLIFYRGNSRYKCTTWNTLVETGPTDQDDIYRRVFVLDDFPKFCPREQNFYDVDSKTYFYRRIEDLVPGDYCLHSYLCEEFYDNLGPCGQEVDFVIRLPDEVEIFWKYCPIHGINFEDEYDSDITCHDFYPRDGMIRMVGVNSSPFE